MTTAGEAADRCSTTSTRLTDDRGLFEHARTRPPARARLLPRRRRPRAGRPVPRDAGPGRPCAAWPAATSISCWTRVSPTEPATTGWRSTGSGATRPGSVTGGAGRCGGWASPRRSAADAGHAGRALAGFRIARAAPLAAPAGDGLRRARARRELLPVPAGRGRAPARCCATPSTAIGAAGAAIPAGPGRRPRLPYGNAAVAEALIVAGDALADARRARPRAGAARVPAAHRDPRRAPVGDPGRRPRPAMTTAPASTSSPSRSPPSPTPAPPRTGSPPDPRWLTGIRLAWRWFLGDNDSATPMFDPQTGGGYDGLQAHGPQPEPGRRVHPGHARPPRSMARWISELRVIARRVCRLELRPDPARVIAQLFLPGEERHLAPSRAADRRPGLRLDEDEVEQLADSCCATSAAATATTRRCCQRHASIVVRACRRRPGELSAARTLLLGASFTAEYATEGAALCNPSAVAAPRPERPARRARPGWRSACAASAKGTSPRSASASAVVGPGAQWTFEPRRLPVAAAVTSAGHGWRREHLQRSPGRPGQRRRADRGRPARPARRRSTAPTWSGRWPQAPPDLLTRPGSRRRRSTCCARSSRRPTTSPSPTTRPGPAGAAARRPPRRATAWRTPGSPGSPRDDGTVEYRATYTAYDGRQIAPRLLLSPDLRIFRAHRLAGPAARNKGMALFPRLVGGRHLALCRSDGESTSLATLRRRLRLEPTRVCARARRRRGRCCRSATAGRRSRPSGAGWSSPTASGRCGSTSIGALLLDLDDPGRVIGRLERPLLAPGAGRARRLRPQRGLLLRRVLHDGLSGSRMASATPASVWPDAVDELLDELLRPGHLTSSVS